MEHIIKDTNNKAQVFINSERGKVFASVVIDNNQYDFVINEKDIEVIKLLIKLNKGEKLI